MSTNKGRKTKGAIPAIGPKSRVTERRPIKATELARRRFLHLATGVASLPAASLMAWAQTWPTRPVRIIAGFPPGGGVDLYARLIAQWLSERLGQQFFVENRPGAGGNLGTEAAAKAPRDGNTLLLAYSGDAWNATLYANLKFNFIRDIEPVATISRGTGVLLVRVPARTSGCAPRPGRRSDCSDCRHP